jgi:exopolysaccharide biosynthesis polyprenyl glycosylphosphotransferase
MHRLRRTLLLEALVVLDLAMVAAALWWAGETPPGRWWEATIRLGDGLLGLAWLAATHALFRSAGLYRSYRLDSLLSLQRRIAAAVAVSSALAALGGAGWRTAAIYTLAATPLLAGTRLVLYRFLAALRRRGHNLRYILVAGAGPRGRRLAAALDARTELGCRVAGFVDEGSEAYEAGGRLLGGFSDLDRLLCSRPIDEVAVALPIKTFYEQIARIVALCEERGVLVRVAGDLFDARLARLESEQVDDLSLLTLFTGRGSALSHAVKRLADAAVSALALAFLAPLLAAIAVAVKLSSPGPVLFGQIRIGQNGRRFRMWKFRSMVADAEARQPALEAQNEVRGAAFKLLHDPRVTRVGRWLRRTSLDELPQLVNVLRGEMSLVGPRPLPERDVERLRHDWQRRRFSVRPGLTGLWQSSGRHRIGFEEWMRMDLDYVDNWSLLLDLKILLRTVPAVWSGAGAS